MARAKARSAVSLSGATMNGAITFPTGENSAPSKGTDNQICPATSAKPFDPLRFASTTHRKRYSRLAKDAETKYRAAVKLHCIECCGWDYKTAKSCSASHCPLWAMNRRIFGSKSVPAPGPFTELPERTECGGKE